MVAIAGEQERNVLFTDQSLDLVEGNMILNGSGPRAEDINTRIDSARVFMHRLLLLLRKERVADGMHRLSFSR